MSYTYNLREVLQEFNGALYKMIRLKVIGTGAKFTHRALPLILSVNDGVHQRTAFMTEISGNQLELDAFFTTDGFAAFGTSSTVSFGYGNDLGTEISGVDVTAVEALPPFFSSYTFSDADDAWLAGL